MSRQKSQGFTLVEILIVVVIMAVLAAVVVPQFTGSTDDAKRSTAEFNLGSLRSVVQTFRAHHEGIKPSYSTVNKSIEGLLIETAADGTAGVGFGPYLVGMPDNPFTNVATVVEFTATPAKPIPTAADVTAGNAGGWFYDKSIGNVWLDSNTQGEFAW
ncbi:MAG: prepilin-type N-terminal cleavage/methylation domain-containing protein [Planctomycetes bacterium]|nr:prepilin-type N-terminal cleavage/methylation domain-containing protein [Planctomycetota bacterium]